MRAWLLMALATGAQARITEVLVFPGGAEVQRRVAVAAGAGEAVFSCIPARIELDSLRARGEGGVRVGEISVQTQSAEAAPNCGAQTQLDAQIRGLEDQKAGLQAERQANELLLQLLRQGGDAKSPPVQLERTRGQALEALKQQHALQRRVEALDEQLKPLLAQRREGRAGVTQWHQISVRVDAAQAGQVVLAHRTRHAGWQPVYRAELDAAGSRVLFERRAELQQTTGESWDGVQLTLSTRQPQRAAQAPDPQPWLLIKQEPMPAMARADMKAFAMPAPAPQAAMAEVAVSGSRAVDAPPPSFETEYDLQFRVPGATSLASANQRRSLTLERQTWPVELHTQVQPAQQAEAYLVATLKRPAGFYPAGNLQLLRDGELVGQGYFSVGEETEQQLGFGRDERLRVRVEPEQRDGANAGFIASRREISLSRRYVLENTGKQALRVRVLEAAPHAQHEDIRVEARFSPEPLAGIYRELPGLRRWEFPLAPGQSQTLGASYKLSAPKDMLVIGWP